MIVVMKIRFLHIGHSTDDYSISLAKIEPFLYLANKKSHSFFGNVSANVSKICKRLKNISSTLLLLHPFL